MGNVIKLLLDCKIVAPHLERREREPVNSFLIVLSASQQLQLRLSSDINETVQYCLDCANRIELN